MSSLNKILLIGRVGKDPELRYTPSGDAVATFSLATSERWTDKQSGEKTENTEWHNCVAFKKTAEVAAEWVKKGTMLYLEGKIKTEKWTDKDGRDRYSTKVYVSQLQMLGKQEHKPQEEQKAPVDDSQEDIPF